MPFQLFAELFMGFLLRVDRIRRDSLVMVRLYLVNYSVIGNLRVLQDSEFSTGVTMTSDEEDAAGYRGGDNRRNGRGKHGSEGG